MTKAGVECHDTRMYIVPSRLFFINFGRKRLVALIAQKFMTDVVNDAMHFHRLRASGGGSAPGGRTGAGGKRNTLTLEDLSAALAEYGINVRRPPYYT